MQLPAKIAYALKATMELALIYDSQKAVNIKWIAQKQDISSKFLLQLMVRLKNAGIVTSERGAQGGYRLTRDPSKLSLSDVIQAVDSSLLAQNALSGSCVISDVWGQLNAQLRGFLEGQTLADLAAKRKAVEGFVYTI